jgi:hypothetical protein
VDAATGELIDALATAQPDVLLSLRHDFPEAWARLKEAPTESGVLEDVLSIELELRRAHYPWWFSDRALAAEDATLHAIFAQVPSGGETSLDPDDRLEGWPQGRVGTAPDETAPGLEDLEPSDGEERRRWWAAEFPGGKPASVDGTTSALVVSVNRNDMTDILVVLSAPA